MTPRNGERHDECSERPAPTTGMTHAAMGGEHEADPGVD